MNISKPFILRPVATSLFMLAVLVVGLLAWRLMPVAALPQVDYPIIQIFTFHPGASPDVTARTITAPLERSLGQIPGIRHMSSTSAQGVSAITLQFSLDVDLGVAEQEVQAAINTANSLLPNDLPAPPVYRKVNPADTPILTLAITSPSLPMPQVHDLVDTRMAQKLAQLPGVGMVSLAGGQKPALRVQVDPAALTARNLSSETVRNAIAAANSNQAKGSFDGPFRSTMLDANDQITSAEDYKKLILAWNDGAPLRLGDVAQIVEGAENRLLAAWADDMPAVLVNVQRQPGANVIEVADHIADILPHLIATLPASVDVITLTDRTLSIRASIRDVQKELLFAIGLVVLVTLVFLRTLPATLIPSIAVPLSLIGTFSIMYLLGFSINNLTLMALTIATGFVVDDAIVMLENITRHREQGVPPMQAALKGASEIGFTLISLTVSLVAVLIPLLFMGDVVGRLFHEFAVTLAVAIGISLVVSLTLTPMMSARMLTTDRSHDHNGALMSRIIEYYDHGLKWVLKHQPLTLCILLATIGLTAVLYVMVPKGFFPIQDSGVIQAVTEAPQNISFQAMAERQQAMAALILQDKDVESLSSFIGVDGSNVTLNSGRMLINLTAHDERQDTVNTVIQRLRERITEIDGMTAWFQPVQELSIEDRVSRTQYQFTLTSPETVDLDYWVPELLERLQHRPELSDVASDLQSQGLQIWLHIDRDAAARLDVRLSAVTDALQNAFGQRQITTLFTHANQYRVVLEVPPKQATGPEDLNTIYVPAQTGRLIPLSTLVSLEQRSVPLLLNQQGQFPTATLSFNLAQGYSLGDAVQAIEEVQASLDMPIYMELNFQGSAEAFRASLSNTLWLILAAIVTMYIVLGILYESLIHPVTILSTLPSAALGALLALLIVDQPLDMIAVIGIVLLIGLVKKNGIMMVDFALDAQRHQGLSPQDAIHQAALMRFRPILMTTLAALFGAIPLMLASGSGAELRQPLGIVMVGGLIVSQILTLFTTPVVYLFFDRLQFKQGQETRS